MDKKLDGNGTESLKNESNLNSRNSEGKGKVAKKCFFLQLN